jgi:DNA polymerase III alpha subunit (gram-positive type)
MYNTYQNRVTSAREVMTRAMLQYDNDIQAARLQNNSILAEIAYQSLQQQLELSLQGFQYKNNLILEQANKKVEMDNMYYQRYQDVLAQINHENAMAEEIRQFNQNYELQMKQYNESIRQFNQEYALREKEYKESIRQFNEEIARLKKKDEQEYKMQIQELELKKKQVEQEKKQWEAEMKLKEKQLAEEKRQFDETMAYNKSKSTGGGNDTPKPAVVDPPRITDTPQKAYPNQTGSFRDRNYTTNKASLNAIGLGNVTAAELARLLEKGIVKRTVKNGQYYYTMANPGGLKNMGLSQGGR